MQVCWNPFDWWISSLEKLGKESWWQTCVETVCTELPLTVLTYHIQSIASTTNAWRPQVTSKSPAGQGRKVREQIVEKKGPSGSVHVKSLWQLQLLQNNRIHSMSDCIEFKASCTTGCPKMRQTAKLITLFTRRPQARKNNFHLLSKVSIHKNTQHNTRVRLSPWHCRILQADSCQRVHQSSSGRYTGPYMSSFMYIHATSSLCSASGWIWRSHCVQDVVQKQRSEAQACQVVISTCYM
jgi:hypothetical protein